MTKSHIVLCDCEPLLRWSQDTVVVLSQSFVKRTNARQSVPNSRLLLPHLRDHDLPEMLTRMLAQNRSDLESEEL